MDNRSNPIGSNGWFQGNDLVLSAQSGASDAYISANSGNFAKTNSTFAVIT